MARSRNNVRNKLNVDDYDITVFPDNDAVSTYIETFMLVVARHIGKEVNVENISDPEWIKENIDFQMLCELMPNLFHRLMRFESDLKLMNTLLEAEALEKEINGKVNKQKRATKEDVMLLQHLNSIYDSVDKILTSKQNIKERNDNVDEDEYKIF